MLAWLLLPFRLIGRVVRRFLRERFAQTAAALSFATLLGLAPMIALAYVVIGQLPFAQELHAAVERFLQATLLPDKAGRAIAHFVDTVASRSDRLTLWGAAGLILTALIQLLTIEHAFNEIWRVRAPRSLLQRLGIHLLVLLLGPLVFGSALLATTYLAGISFGLFESSQWLSTTFFRLLPLGFLTVLLSTIYWGLPNRAVPFKYAAFGGFLAACGVSGLHQLFNLYVAGFAVYRELYGAFAAAPIFLTWLYATWGVILAGALISAELPAVIPTAASKPLTESRAAARHHRS